MTEIVLHAVCRDYPGPVPVRAVSNASLTIAAGEFVSITGPSGSGKSTLLNLIALLDQPTSGHYTLGGEAMEALPEQSRAAHRASTFGFVFQRFHLLDRYTVLENVELSLMYRGVPRDRRREMAMSALDRVSLLHRAGHQASALSGGEQQRVSIARAVAGGAAVLVADEPTGNLDTRNGTKVLTVLQDVHRSGSTVLLVTHDLSLAAAADRQIEMRDGEIVADTAESLATISPASARGNTPGVESRRSVVGPWEVTGEALRSVRRRVGRTAALAGAVAVAVALVVATLSLSQTAAAQVSDRFDIRRNREVTVTADPTWPSSDIGGDGLAFPVDAEERVRALAGVEAVGAIVDADDHSVATTPNRDGEPVRVLGISPGLLRTVAARVVWGYGSEQQLGPLEALVGALAAERLHLPPVAQHPVVFVDGSPFAVVGVIRDVGRARDLVSSVVISAGDTTRLSGYLANQSVLIATAPGAGAQVAGQAALALDAAIPQRFKVEAPADPRTLRADIEGDVRLTMLVLSAVALVASVVSVANALSMGMAERIAEFGLRRAFGARRRHVLGQVAVEAATIGLLGGLGGLYLGMLGVLAVTVANGWQPVLDLSVLPLALICGCAVGVVGGSAAAVRAGRVEPVEALRR